VVQAGNLPCVRTAVTTSWMAAITTLGYSSWMYAWEEALLKRLQAREDTPELQAELASVRAAIRRSLRHEDW
jgi:hypothetical protein